jgi:hypothetical protein
VLEVINTSKKSTIFWDIAPWSRVEVSLQLSVAFCETRKSRIAMVSAFMWRWIINTHTYSLWWSCGQRLQTWWSPEKRSVSVLIGIMYKGGVLHHRRVGVGFSLRRNGFGLGWLHVGLMVEEVVLGQVIVRVSYANLHPNIASHSSITGP